ncbi:hypothetical protein Glove_92g59 [Diversispora epigaea]|uniref:RNase H type-1 domain-containing protein n=1 Tax=Diversispora epigaea TaxID=1348612 RepID=A0A397J569_9GLOM|nr:hypothetical protein Glove_92g59 [Diversispora epigaea]
MGCILPNIKEDTKVTVLGSVVVLRVASGINRWVISLDANLEIEFEVLAGRMKYVSVTNNNLNNENNNVSEEPIISEPETSISSDSEQDEEETRVPIVHISDIKHASPRQFFERFLPVEYIMSTVISSTNEHARASERLWKDLTWMEFMRFIEILTIMTYVQCLNICDYWSTVPDTGGVALEFDQYMSHRRFRDIVKYLKLTNVPTDNDDPFHFARKFHNVFNENLAKAIIPCSFFCIDKSMCQWMVNLLVQLDPCEPPEHTNKKKFSEYSATIATILRLTEPWFNSGRTIIADSWFGSVNDCTILYKHGFYSILQLKKRRYWPKNIPYDITDALGSAYGSFVSRTGKFDNVDLTLCSIHDRKNIVLLASCSTTNLKTEITRYIKGHGNVKFRRPAIFDEYNEYRSAIDIFNNLRDNALSYHNVLTTKCSKNRILAFYFSAVEANSYSAYCQFVPVVIPMLEYSLNDMTLSEKECLKITTKFISIIKNKALLPITAPNVLIHAKEAYDVCHLWDRQLQMQSNNLFNRLNDKVICKTHDLTFKLSKNLNDNLLIKGGNITIEEILDDKSQYRMSDLCIFPPSIGFRFLFIRPVLVSHNGKILLHWQEITNNDRRGPKPGWFKTLENKLLTNIKTRVLSAEMQTTLGERYNICNWNIGKQSNSINWVAIQNAEGTRPLIGKKRKMLNKDEFTIQHHTKEVSSQSSGNSVLEKCTGCAQGDRSLVANLKNQDVCLIKTSMAKSVSINVVRSVVSLRTTPDRSNRLRLRSSQNAIRDDIGKIIEDSLPVGSIRSIDPPTVYISNNARDRTTMFAKFQNFWTQENIQTKLDDIRLKLSSSMSIRIYTDGSLIKKDKNNSHVTTMGCGWCAFNENDTEFNFSGKVENFASSTRAELMAILTAVYATPKHSRLCIFTDSQAAIDAIANATANPRKAHRKLKNWTIVKAIEEIASVQNLTLQLEKVKAHSGVIHNEMADKLAKEGCFKPVCFPDLQSLTSVNAMSCWNTETIEEPLRHFTKKLGKAKHSIKWRLLNQNISTISAFKSKQIQWESSWRTTILSYIDRNVTDNKETRQRAFNVKLFNNELPTLEKLKDRFPKIYETDSCIRCNLEKEDQVHVLTCPKNLIDIHSCRNKLINLLVSKTTTVACGDMCKNMCKTLEALTELHISRDVSTLIPITVYDIVLQKVVTHELADQIIDDVFNQFKLFLHTHIWKDRCAAVKKWETENGISNNKWKKKVHNETLDTTVTSQTNNTDNSSVLNNTTQDLYIIMLSKIAVIGLGCIK